MIVQKLKSLLSEKHSGELLRGSSGAFAVKMFGIAFAYLFTVIITRGFGAKAMGIFALAYTVLQISSVLGLAGMDSAMLRFTAEYSAKNNQGAIKDLYRKGLGYVLAVSLLLSAILFLIAPALAAYVFQKPHLAPYIRNVSLGIAPMSLLFLHAESLRGLKRSRLYTFLTQVAVFMFASAVLIIIMQFSKNIWVPVTSFVIALVLVSVLSFIFWGKNARLGAVERTSAMSLRSMAGVALPMMLASSLTFVMQWTDTVMLGIFRTESEVGVYAVSFRIARLTLLTIFAVNVIAAPKFAELFASKDIAGLGTMASNSTRLIFWTTFPIVLVIFLIPGFILGLFGHEFIMGSVALLLLTVGQTINAMSGSVGAMLNMTGKQRVFQNIIFVATVINIVLNYLLIPRYGINGAAFASMISVALWNISCVIYIKRAFNINFLYIPLWSDLRKSNVP